MSIRYQRGMTLAELVVVLAISVLVLGVSALVALPMLARESMRSATYDVQTAFQLGRIEAVNRNMQCRMILHRTERWLRVEDIASGEVLHEFDLPDAVAFARPDAGAAVTLPPAGPRRHRVVFNPDGTVMGGGDVHLYGGQYYRRISLFDAGGVDIRHWDGSTWISGS